MRSAATHQGERSEGWMFSGAPRENDHSRAVTHHLHGAAGGRAEQRLASARRRRWLEQLSTAYEPEVERREHQNDAMLIASRSANWCLKKRMSMSTTTATRAST